MAARTSASRRRGRQVDADRLDADLGAVAVLARDVASAMPGSSPTSSVPSPGAMPCVAQRGDALGELGLDGGRGGDAVERDASRRHCSRPG